MKFLNWLAEPVNGGEITNWVPFLLFVLVILTSTGLLVTCERDNQCRATCVEMHQEPKDQIDCVRCACRRKCD